MSKIAMPIRTYVHGLQRQPPHQELSKGGATPEGARAGGEGGGAATGGLGLRGREASSTTTVTGTNSPIPTPIKAKPLIGYLAGYSPSVVHSLKLGFKEGFQLQNQGDRLFREAPNLESAIERPEILRQKIRKEVRAGRIAGPFQHVPFTNLQVSPLGLVPKQVENEFRLIHHLSFPAGTSINDGIDPQDTYVSYQSIDDAIRCVTKAGKQALMACVTNGLFH